MEKEIEIVDISNTDDVSNWSDKEIRSFMEKVNSIFMRISSGESEDDFIVRQFLYSQLLKIKPFVLNQETLGMLSQLLVEIQTAQESCFDELLMQAVFNEITEKGDRI